MASLGFRFARGAAIAAGGTATILLGAMALATPSARPLTERETAFSRHLQAYDGLAVGVIAKADDWDLVCEATDYMDLADVSARMPGTRSLAAAAPLTIGDGVENETVADSDVALVFLEGRHVVDVVLVRNVHWLSYGDCHGRAARFAWTGEDAQCSNGDCGDGRGRMRIVETESVAGTAVP